MEGITTGFRLTTKYGPYREVDRDNYASTVKYKSEVQKQINTEIELGNYVITNRKPTIVSSLGAVEKPDGGIRLIHDASRPLHCGLNSYTSDTTCSYMDLRNAIQLIKPKSFLAKVDLKSAYRSVKIHPAEYQLSGLKWTFEGDNHPTYMYDSKLMFGHSKSPQVFQKISAAVCAIMRVNYNVTVISYLDDFLIIEDDFNQCNRALGLLLKTLRQLGFNISWKKVDGPSQRLVFLGVLIDTCNLTLSMPAEKMSEFRDLLISFKSRKRASVRQLQSLCGKLNWASSIVKGGRTFTRRMIDLIPANCLGSSKVLLSSEFFKDLDWWIQFMEHFNGSVYFLDQKPITSLQTDACTQGCAGYYAGDYFYTNWDLDFPEMSNEHINIKETMAVILSALRWGQLWCNKTVTVYTDNMTTKCAINKGSSKNSLLMYFLRELFWLSAIFNFDIKAKFIPGRLNNIADSASRLNEPGQLSRLYSLIHSYNYMDFTIEELLKHMSCAFFINSWCTGPGDHHRPKEDSMSVTKTGVG